MIERLLFTASTIVLLLLTTLTTLRANRLLQRWTPPGNLMLSVPDNLVRLVLLGICIVLGYTIGPGPEVLGWQPEGLLRNLLLGAVIGLALATALNWAGQAAVKRWGPEVYDTRMLRCVLPASRREWPWLALALLPAAALEEIVFRSFPLGGLSWLVAPWWLMWPLAVLFGLLHSTQGGWGIAGTTLAALALSLLFLGTGSIWAPLAAHYVMNIHQLAAATAAGLTPTRKASQPSTRQVPPPNL